MDKLTEGYLYRIRTLIPPQRLQREHMLTYLGPDTYGKLQFSARPYYGTQQIDPDTILMCELVDLARGRYDERHYMNKVVR